MKGKIILFVLLLISFNCYSSDDDCKTPFVTEDNCEILNAGNDNCNAVYVQPVSGKIIINGKNSYYGGKSEVCKISWDITFGWCISDSDDNILYYINEDTKYPPTSDAWQVLTGTSPAPSSIYTPVRIYYMPCTL
jgi:hypothetical protein